MPSVLSEPYFTDEQAAFDRLEAIVWRNGITCPHCGMVGKAAALTGVKDKKGRLFLLVLGEETAVDLKRVHETIGAQGRVSFGSAELLEEVWGVKPGAVTPFGAVNDQAGKVRVVLDEAMMRHERLNFHPLVNTRTTGLASADLVKFLRATGHEPLIAPLGRAPVE